MPPRMNAALVRAAGQPPVYAACEVPSPAPGEIGLTVTASALSQLARGRASGTHYSATGHFPFVAGVDGVGRSDDGSRFYFALPPPPHGGMAERTVVPAERCIPLPDGLDDITAAAIANPGMSSWAALTERAGFKRGETVLINGATGMAGRLAVQIARHLGAGRIIVTGRNETILRDLTARGADAAIALTADAAFEARAREAFAQGVDVVLDYLWGDSAERLLIAAAKASEDRPLRFVQIGSASGATIALPGAVLRAAAITLTGSGLGSVPLPRLVGVLNDLFRAAGPAGLAIPTRPVPLSALEDVWPQPDSAARIVFTMNGP